MLCRTTNYCLNLAADQEKTATENWLHELDVAIDNAKHCLNEECKYVRGLVSNFCRYVFVYQFVEVTSYRYLRT